ncbi:hypothetical protein H4CHR_00633 [Variovorax sp. PBS-H4]|uniref:hypothetical protein n=1 Tax=Variovorax sp. PBS-H4 TaxID=434008 RepID=UPI001315D54B|nr:hypothetical protein [Variovorax sp. PBS-H4]VTU20678.1 hypothetical protein H4CHR_00633 [Variovorax sp. PBS-H4]
MTSAAAARPSLPSDVAFGNLIDLAMLRTGAVSVEVCEACNTINLGAAKLCKGCSHKLPAFYGATHVDEPLVPPSGWGATRGRGWTWDLAAFWLVINSLAGVTALSTVL